MKKTITAHSGDVVSQEKSHRRLTAEGWKRRAYAQKGKSIQLTPAPVAQIQTEKKQAARGSRGR